MGFCRSIFVPLDGIASCGSLMLAATASHILFFLLSGEFFFNAGFRYGGQRCLRCTVWLYIKHGRAYVCGWKTRPSLLVKLDHQPPTIYAPRPCINSCGFRIECEYTANVNTLQGEEEKSGGSEAVAREFPSSNLGHKNDDQVVSCRVQTLTK